MALALQRRQRERGVMRGQPRTVVKPGFRPQRKTIGQLVGGDLDRFRGQPIHRVRLIVGAPHQRRKRHVHALRAVALQNVGVERIESLVRLIVGTDPGNDRKQSALGRRRINVVEMMKIRRVFEITERRHAVGCAGFARGCRQQACCAQRANAKAEHMPAGEQRIA